MSKICYIFLILFLCFTQSIFAQPSYYQIDGNNCSASGTSPEWSGTPINDPNNDTNAAGTDLVNYWSDYDPDTDQFCFAFERYSTQSNGPSATYIIFFDLDCDANTGYTGYGQGGDVAIGLEWKVNGPWDVIKFTFGQNNPEILGQAFVGQAICNDPASQGRFAEFCFNLQDLILSGYDPCACNAISTPGVITLAGGSINSEPKDFLDQLIDVEIEVNVPPIADGVVNPSEICLGSSISYDGTLSTDDVPVNDVLTYIWDFDYDGFSINTMSTSPTGTHTYLTAGYYDVLLQVSDSYGCPDTIVFPVNVYAPPVAVMDLDFDECDFTFLFDGSQSIENNVPQNLQYAWDFGDGQTSNQQIGVVTYDACGTYTVTLTVTDPDAPSACNTDFVTQDIVFDNTPPTLVCPTLVTGSCGIDSVAAYTTIQEFIDDGGTATDNCPLTSIQLIAEAFDNNTCGGSLLRIYQVTDFCGQTATCEQSIEINDDVAPTFTCPPTVTTSCSIVDLPVYTDLAEFIAAGGIAEDNCEIDPISFNLVSESTDSGSCPETISRVYQISDVCGNTAECTQSITVNDVLPPVAIAPPVVVAICDFTEVDAYDDIYDFLNAGGTITDNCGIDSTSFTFVMDTTDFNSCPEIVQMVYSVADLCGNTTTISQSIEVNDQIFPTISCPTIYITDCHISQIPVITTYIQFQNEGGSADDNCGLNESSFTLLSQVTDSLSCPESITRRYAISDLCGNQSFCDQLIIVDDQVSPVMNCPGDLLTACLITDLPPYSDLSAFLLAGGTVSDNCGLLENTFALSSEISDNLSCPETITRTYTIQDSCNNPITCQQIITVNDTEGPAFTCPSQLTAVCSIAEQIPYPTLAQFIGAGGSANDNCGLNISTFEMQSEVSDGNTCPETITRTYYIEDLCGNAQTCTQQIIVDDNIAPQFTSPGDLTGVCVLTEHPIYSDYNEFISAGGSASDNCALVTGSFILLSENTNASTCPEIVTRTYQIFDACNNSATFSQVITVDDQINPTINCPSDLTAVCDILEQAPYMDLASFEAAGGSVSDNCAIVTSSFALQSEASNGNTCPEIITRIYEIADACGNVSTCSQIILVDDTIDPTFSCPGDLTAVCDAAEQVPYADLAAFEAAGGVASDNCDIDDSSFVLQSELTDGNTCPETITRIYFVADLCGNGVTCEQIITINDDVNPTMTCPGDLTAVCDIAEQAPYADLAAFTSAGGLAEDNCDIDDTSFMLQSEISDGNTCPETVTRIYYVEDLCGNGVTCEQIITVDDNVDPTMSCPGDLTAVCSIVEQPLYADYTSFIAAGGTASDNCAINQSTFVLQSEVSDGTTCPETITRTYYVEDLCGNQITCEQVIIVNDTEAPIFTSPGDLTGVCLETEQAPYSSYTDFTAAGGTASDNCTLVESSFALQSEVSNGNTCPEVITRIYEIEDQCGNVSTFEQIFTIDDDINPTIICPGDLTSVCDISEQVPYSDLASFESAGGSVGDNCAVVASTFALQSETSDSNTCPETVTRIYEIADACGNISTCTQLILINDDIDPIISCPGDLTAVCDASEQAPYADLAAFEAAGGSVSDNCDIDDSSFVLQSELTDGNTCPETITRIYFVADLCGNGVTCEQIVIVNDNIDPTMTCPGDLTAVCDINEQAPYADFAAFTSAGGSAADNCDINDASFILQSEVSDGNTCPETVTRIYYVEDLCGNGVTCEQVIMVDDNVDPTMACPGDLTAVCDLAEQAPYADYISFIAAGGLASDNCAINESTFVLQSEVSAGTTCPETITRTYYVEDLCGNQVTCEQVIIVNDTEDPVFTSPGDLTGVCLETEHAPYSTYSDFVSAGGTASDNCTLVESTFVLQSEVSDGNTCPEIITRIYEIADQCGNVSTFEQTFTINDDINPTIVCPGDLTAVCDIAEQAPYIDLASFISAGGSVADNCAVVESTFALQSETSDSNTCPETVTRIYEIADACGNISTCTQLIEINDDIDPMISCPGDLTAVCDASEQAPYTDLAAFIAAGGTASDNCDIDDASFVLQSELTDGNTCPETITRIYFVADLCGNGVTCQQIITVDDDTDPTMTCPGDLIAVCDITEQAPYTDFSAFASAGGSAEDNCAINEASFILQSEVSDGNTCPETVTRIYYVEDLCGNGVTCEQVITVDDDINPTMTCPGDLTAVCSITEQVPYPDYTSFVAAGGTAADNCAINESTFVLQSELSDGTTCPETITRTYYVEDLCGNGVTCEQVIVVNDTEAPVFTSPGDLTGICALDEHSVYTTFSEFSTSGGTASDNCTLVESTFALQSEVSDGNTCPEVVTRIYEIADQCGNVSTFEQIITINDQIFPEIICPGDLTAVCDITEQVAYIDLASFEAAGGSVSDNCAVVASSFALQSETSNGSTCPETVTRIYEIADACGNISTCTQLIMIDDEIDPLMTCPGDLTAICDAAEQAPYADYAAFISAGGATSDNCQIDEASFTLQSELSDGNTCPETITRIYYVADLCGNGVTCEQIITVDDDIDPTMTCPGDLTAVCTISEQPAYGNFAAFTSAGGNAEDNCAINESSFTLQSEVSDGNTCPETVTRIYYVEDLCGNGVTCEQIITIDDDINPTMTCPGDLTAVCSITEQLPYVDYAAFLTAGGNAADNCDINISSFVLQSELSDGTTCPETITRTYYIEDLCGNPITCEQVIIVNDTEAPIFDSPGDLDGVCTIAEHPMYTSYADFTAAGGSASDNCTLIESSFTLQSESSDGNTCPETIVRIYEIADQCGNVSTFEQEITINDQIAPIMDCPANEAAVCDASEVAIFSDFESFVSAGGSASDNCGLDLSSFVLQSEVSNGNTCPETVLRTYYIADNCGNGTTCVQEIEVNDDQLPEMTCPGELAAICSVNEHPAYANLAEFLSAGGEVSDNCGIEESTFFLQSQVSDNNTCPETITRTYYIEDLCGNPITCTQQVVINDDINPELTCPSGLDGVCSIEELPPYANYQAFISDGGSASDNCDINESSFSMISEVSDGLTCPETITRTYYVEDLCGNSSTCNQIVTINDEEAPSFESIPDLTFNCTIAEYPPFSSLDEYIAAGFDVDDNCQIDPSSFMLVDELADGATCPQTFTRRYSIADICGNVSTVQQSILISDNIPPTITAPDQLGFQCPEDLEAPYNTFSEFVDAGGNAFDNCDIDPSSFTIVNEFDNGLTCPQQITRIYSISDLCGNTSSVEHLVKINDEISPEVICPPSRKGICGISEVPAYQNYNQFFEAGGIATDNCGIDESSFTLINQSSNGATCPEVVTRIYQISDFCGNTAICQVEIFIEDEIDPTMTCPANLTAICSINEQPAYTNLTQFLDAGGNVGDNCQIMNASFTLVSEISDGNTCPEVVTRTYEISDLCGNTASCSQEITINDEVAPVFVANADLTTSCVLGDIPPFSSINDYKSFGGNVTDNCGLDPASFEMLSETSDGLTCPETVTRIYTVSDFCGNTATIDHHIIINDLINPVLNCPPAQLGVCNIDEIPPYIDLASFVSAGGTASDNCALNEMSFTLVSEESDGETCPETFTRTYSIRDLCENETTCTQLIIINDVVPPIFTNTEVLTGQCSIDEVPPYLNMEDFIAQGGTLEDNCGIDPTSFTLELESESTLSCPKLYGRVYSVSDLCGNISTFPQSILIDDSIAPVMNCPVGATGTCSSDEVPTFLSYQDYLNAGGTVLENCELDEDSFTLTGEELISDICPMIIRRFYSITDVCGNIGSCFQEISINDEIAPELLSPTNDFGNCDISEYPAFATFDAWVASGGSATDNCAINPASFTLIAENSSNTSCPLVVTRIYVVADFCGNTTTAEHTISINDEIAPVIICPSDVSDICSIEESAAATTLDQFELIGGSVSDNCNIDPLSFALVSENISQTTCPTTIDRVYQIADLCGNISTCSQTIIVNDQEAPQIIACPTDITLQCDSETNQAAIDLWLQGIEATDNCSIESITNDFQNLDGPCTGVGTTTVQFLVVDACNNISACAATLTIIDTIAPVADDLVDIIIDSLNQLPPIDVTVVTGESDDCDNFPTVIWSGDEYEINASCSGTSITISRTYQVIDCSGNVSDVVQTIIMDDDPILVSTEKENVTCFGGSDGSIEISVTGGQPEYTYDWNNDLYDGQTILENLSAGTYVVTVTDENNCTQEKSIQINQPSQAIDVNISPVAPVICAGTSVMLTANISFGTAPFDYEWMFENNTFDTESIIVSEAGVYTVMITDDNGCSAMDEITLQVIPAVTLNPVGPLTGCEFVILEEITGTNLSGNELYYTQTNGNGTAFLAGDTIWSTTTLYIYDETGSSPNCFDEVTVLVELNEGPAIDNPGDQFVCASYFLPAITGANLTSAVAYFTQPNGQGLMLAEGDEITENSTIYIYDAGVECAAEVYFSVSIIIKPEIDPLEDVVVCDSYVLPAITGENLTGNELYYTGTNGSGTAYPAFTEILNSVNLFIFDGGANCNDEETFSITINDTPQLVEPDDVLVCNYYVLPAILGTDLTGSEAYFTASNATGDLYVPGDTIFEDITLFIYDIHADCSAEVDVLINLVETPVINPLMDVATCDYFVLPEITGDNLTGNEAYFNAPSGLGNEFEAGDTIFITTVLYIFDQAGTCFDQDQFTVTVGGAPDIFTPNPITACGYAILPVIQGENLGGNATYFTESMGGGIEYLPGDTVSMTTQLFLFIEAGSCTDEEIIDINILPSPILDVPADANSCDQFELPVITGTDLTGNQAYYTESGGNGISYAPGEVILTSTTLFIYDANAVCGNEVVFNIIISLTPILDDVDDVTTCESYILPAIAGSPVNAPKYFSDTNGEGDIFFPGDVITETQILYIYDENNGCADEVLFEVMILQTPDLNEIEDVTACDQFILPAISGSDLSSNVMFYDQPGGNGNSFVSGDIIDQTIQLFVFDSNGPCFDEVTFNLTIVPTPIIDQPLNVSVCDQFVLPAITGQELSGNESYFQFANGQGNSLQAGDIITTSSTIFLYDQIGDCFDEKSFDVEIIPTPEIDSPANLTVCALYILPEITGSNLSENASYFSGVQGTGIEYFVGDTLYSTTTLFIFDSVNGCDDQTQYTVEILDGPNVSDIPDVLACVTYTLPEIDGVNLTSNAGYFSAPNGGGTNYAVGDVISVNSTIYIYDAVATCFDEEVFTVTITGIPNLNPISDVEACDFTILSAISGSNMSGNQNYFTQSQGQGDTLFVGDTIFNSMTVYAFDTYTDCNDEREFFIEIFTTPLLNPIENVVVCDFFVLPEIFGSDLSDPTYFTGVQGTGSQLEVGDTIWAAAEIFVFDENGPCSHQTSFDITFSPAPSINELEPITSCEFVILPIIIGQNLTGNQAYFTETTGNGAMYSIGDTIFETINLYAYDVAGGCFSEVLLEIEVLATPVIDPLNDAVVCDFFILPVITGQNIDSYVYSSLPFGNGEIFQAGDTIWQATTVYVEAQNGICTDNEDLTVVFSGVPSLDPIDSVTACDFYILEEIDGDNLTGSEAYFTELSGQGTSYNVGDTIFSSSTLFVFDMAGGCYDEITFDITITITPQLDEIEDVVVCDYYVLETILGSDLNNPQYFTLAGGNGSILTIGDTIWNASTIHVYDVLDGCEAETSFNVIFSPAPELAPIDAVTVCDYYVLAAINGINLTGSEAYFTLANGAGTSYQAGDTIFTSISLFAFDVAGGCSSEEILDITIIQSPEITPIQDAVVCDYFVLPTLDGTNIDSYVYSTQVGGNGTIYQAGDTVFSATTIFIEAINGICSAVDQFVINFSGIPAINPINDVVACDFYILPEITGTNLTGNEAYYTETLGQGLTFSEDDTVFTTTNLFVYDVAGGCYSEIDFSITIDYTPEFTQISDVEICEFYVLPVIQGNNLNNPVYSSNPGGEGTVYVAGDTIFNSSTIFLTDANGTCDVQTSFNILPGATPMGSIGEDAAVCFDEGLEAELTITVSGSFPITVELFKDNNFQETIILVTSPTVLTVTEPGVYTIQSMTTADNCSGTTSGTATVIGLESISVTEPIVECSMDGLSYTVSFEISGGTPHSYLINNALVNTSGEDPYIHTESFDAGSGPYNFTIFDENLCNTVVIADEEPNCECETAVGTMNSGTLEFCDTQSMAIASYDDTNQVLEDDDVLIFILHDGTPSTIGNIIDTNSLPEFSFDDMTMDLDVVYYISAVVGNAASPIDLNDPCLGIASTPVMYLSAPTAVIDGNIEDCIDSNISVPVTLTGNGPWTVVYEINNIEVVETGITESPFYIEFVLTEETNIVLISVASSCEGIATGEVNVTIVDDLSAELTPSAEICNLAIKGSTINFTDLIIAGNTNGEWTDVDNSGATGTLPNLDFDGVTPGDYTFLYTIGAGSDCGEVSYSVIITVVECVCPLVSVEAPEDVCVGSLINLNDYVLGEAGTWELVGNSNTDISIDENNILTIDGQQGGTLELLFTLTTIDPDCPSDTTVAMQVDQPVSAGDDQVIDFCEMQNDVVNVNDLLTNADLGGIWTIPSALQEYYDASSSTLLLNEITEGTYTLQYEVTSALEICGSETAEIVIIINALPVAAIEAVEPLDCENPNTTITVNEMSGNAHVVFNWTTADGNISGSTTLKTITVNAPGTYEIIITDTLTNCTTSEMIEVQGTPDFIIANAGDDQELTCAQVVVMLDGSGSSNGDYVYQWFDGEGNEINGADGMYYETDIAGQYILMVLNEANGCVNMDTVIVSEIINYPIASILTPDMLTCDIQEVLVNGNNSTVNDFVNYQWYNSNGVLVAEDTLEFTTTEPGYYYLHVVDSTNMCESLDTVFVDENVVSPQVAISPDFILDCVTTEGTIEATISTENTQYQWYDQVGNELAIADLDFIVDTAGVFTIEVMNLDNGCTMETSVTVALDTIPVTGLEVEAINPCDNPFGGSIEVKVAAGAGNLTYELSNGTVNNDGTFINLQPGDYTVIVTGENGCAATEETILHGNLDLDLFAGDDVEIDLGESVQLTAITTIPDSEVSDLYWTPDNGTLSCTECYDPLATPFYTTEYIVTMEDIYGCVIEDNITIRVDRRTKVYAPNIFSPNDDGINDLWILYSAENVDVINEIYLYNRWGEKVWENFDVATGDESQGWDGTFKGQSVNPGVFAWYAVVTLIDGEQVTLKGDVTVMK